GSTHLYAPDLQPHRAQTRSATTSQARWLAIQIGKAARAGGQPGGMRGGGRGEKSDARRAGEPDGTPRTAEVFRHIAGEYEVAVHAFSITTGPPVAAGQQRGAQRDPIGMSE